MRTGGRKTASAYDAIGAAQVAKASFSGMRLLHRIDGKVAIWPMDELPENGSAVAEIYTRIYIRNAGLSGRRSAPGANSISRSPPSDRHCGADADRSPTTRPTRSSPRRECARIWRIPSAFSPLGLTQRIACTEGWTFGIA